MKVKLFCLVNIIILIMLGFGFISCKKSDTSKEDNAAKEMSAEELKKLQAVDAAVEADAKTNKKSAQAVALVQKVIAYMKKNGVEKTLDAVHDPKNPDYNKFIAGEYYIWVIKTNYKDSAVVVAHAVNKALKGKEWYNAKDPDGKYFFHDIIRVAREKGKGWTEYKWAHPKLKKAMPKLSYCEKADDLIFLCGFYK